MTPAIKTAQKAAIEFQVLEYEHDPKSPSYGLEAAEKLKLDPASVFKTLLVSLNGEAKNLAVAVVPVSAQLDLKTMAKACKAKKAAMADPAIAERTTGYRLGGISPLGQKRVLPTVIDATAENLPLMYVSAGKRGMDMALHPADLKTLCQASFAAVARIST